MHPPPLKRVWLLSACGPTERQSRMHGAGRAASFRHSTALPPSRECWPRQNETNSYGTCAQCRVVFAHHFVCNLPL